LILIKATVRTGNELVSGDHNMGGGTMKDGLIFRISRFWLVFVAAGGAAVLVYALFAS
jgi:hypothetical protein